MSEPPKLYVNKPKKAQMKQFKGVDAPQSSSSSSSSSSATKLTTPAISSYYSTGSSGSGDGVSKPPQLPKESFARRYKFIWPLLLTVNLAVGAYLFMRTKKKDGASVEETIAAASAPSSTSNAAANASSAPTAEVLPVVQPQRILEPIPEQRQRELFKWILEEKRKIKTKDPEEKKRLDEEKAILKEFIRAKSIPNI